MEPNSIYWLLYSFYCASTLWDVYLSWRQYKLYRRTKERPSNVEEIISGDDFAKSRAYKLDGMHFAFFTTAFNFGIFSIVFLCKLFPSIWNFCVRSALMVWPNSGEVWHSIVFVWFTSGAETVLSLPFNYYNTFYIEQKHGFNKETVPFFFTDRAKKFVVSMLIATPIIALLIWIIKHGGPNFHLYAWAAISLIIFIMMFIYPEFIAPLFDKYTALPDSDLKCKIEQLAGQVEFPLTKLYVVEGSKRSAHSNAYMYGFWKNKRIVLYDTLLNKEMNALIKQLHLKETIEQKTEENSENTAVVEKENGQEEPNEEKSEEKQIGMNDDEVVSILGHELGHWKLYHTFWLLISMEFNLLVMLMVFSLFYKQASLFIAFGFPASQHPILIALMIIGQFVMAPYTEFLSLLQNVVSRKFEFAADRFSANLGKAPQLCSGLIKLGKDNLSMPIDDWLYSWCNHSHPPIPERIETLKKFN